MDVTTTILILVGAAIFLGYFGFTALSERLAGMQQDIDHLIENLPDKD